MMIKRATLTSSLAMLLGLHAAPAPACEGDKAPAATRQAHGDAKAAASIVQRHIAALGGYAALKATSTLSYTLVNSATGDRTQVSMARPNHLRKEHHKAGGTVTVYAFDGSNGWSREGEAQAALVPESERKMMARYSEFDDPLIDYAQRGHQVELLGTEAVNGAPAHHLRLTLKGGQVEDRYLDQASHLEFKRVVTYTKDGKPGQKCLYFSDYRPVDGMVINHALEYEGADGKRVRVAVQDINVNRPLAAALFQRPPGTRLAQAPKAR